MIHRKKWLSRAAIRTLSISALSLSALSLGSMPCQVRADDTTWTGAASNNFFAAGNWTAGAPNTVDFLALIEGGANLPAVIGANTPATSLGAIQIGLSSAGGSVLHEGGDLTIDGSGLNAETVIGGSAAANSALIMKGNARILYDTPIVSGGQGFDTDGSGKDFDIGKKTPEGFLGSLEMRDNSALHISDDLKISDGGGGHGLVTLSGRAQLLAGSGASVAGVSKLLVSDDALFATGNSAAVGDSVQGRTNEGYLTLSTNPGEDATVEVTGNGRIYTRTLQQRGSTTNVTLRDRGQFHVFDVFAFAAPSEGKSTVTGSAQGPQRTSHLSQDASADTTFRLFNQSAFTVDSDLEDSSWSGLAISGGNNRGANSAGGKTVIEVHDQSRFAVYQDLNMTVGTGETAESTLVVRGPQATVHIGGELRMAITPEGDANPGHATLHAVLTGPTHSTISVVEAAHIANGDLVVTLDGYAPRGGEVYQLLTAGSVVGSSFRSAELPSLANGLSWNLQVGAKAVTLRVSLPGDFNSNGILDAADIDQLSAQVRGGTNPLAYDLNSDRLVNDADRDVWVNSLRKTYFGDANLDGVFDSGDFVVVFQAGQYEDTTPGNSGWATGDWNGDADFDSGDFVTAFQAGGYEKGPRAAVQAVPEPTAGLLALPGFLLLAGLRRRR